MFLSAAAPPAVLLATAAVFLVFPPAQYSFYPQCPVYHYLHILCPGCGATRALAALLHGQIVEALRLNPLTTLLTPVAMIYMAVHCRRVFKGQSFSWPHPSPSAIYATLAVASLFAIVRNLK
jgi:hypothetical protein